jgi:hypothetical protein
MADIKADRDRARSALERIKGKSSAASIDGAKIERFGTLMARTSQPATSRSARLICAG